MENKSLALTIDLKNIKFCMEDQLVRAPIKDTLMYLPFVLAKLIS